MCTGVLTFKHKIDTDLYSMARSKTRACSLELSADGEQMVCFCEDSTVRVWKFRSGKLRRTYDESVEQVGN
jgi:peptidylprolyl isomerase domain and WD repeat-containing protein 1